jgi:RNA polymerase sigma factor (sigma-70 family)
VQERSDAELLRDARSSAEAFRLFYDRYAARVQSFFVRRTRDAEASLDLTAETFARAWLWRTRFRDLAGGSAGPWLFAIARSVLVRSVEKRRLEDDARRRLGLLTPTDAITVTPEEDWLDELGGAIDGLPASQRDAVRLRVVAGFSYSEVARTLGCTPLAARVRVSRALSTLRAALEGDLR